ncbi:hypothetical protein FMJ45_05130 [Klebsiella michiganensis]|nr:hypothetical protein [Klebsiella michiganensis]MBZ6600540.1 hypothetical protein [Klebsiella michiganensis]
MLNKIADCAENVVRNFSHREHFPEAMLRICPGCQTCRTHESVARARRVKRRPGMKPRKGIRPSHFPEAMLRICPGC